MSAEIRPFVIGTRGSKLALWQSEHVASVLGAPAELRIIKTSGDRFVDLPLQEQTGKGFFTKEIEDELLAGTIDLAVHSLKDLPTEIPAGLALGAILTRAPAADLLLVHPEDHAPGELVPVRAGGSVGASSLRRQALLRHFAPALRPLPLRGNVPTRLDKLRRRDYAAIVVAKAGLWRMGLDLSDFHVYELDPLRWLPAPGQAAMAVEMREGDTRVGGVLAPLHHLATERAVTLERRLLARFEGGCHAPFGAYARALREGRVELWIGHEDADGHWRAVRVETDYATAEEEGYAALRAELARPFATLAHGGGLCRIDRER